MVAVLPDGIFEKSIFLGSATDCRKLIDHPKMENQRAAHANGDAPKLVKNNLGVLNCKH